ncbi:MAG: hypothetical protein KJO78_12225 [Alphaproteobacteria bacterium]|nr:hypothetical protein [Alphaproteobacteria bacterium]
MRYLVRTFLCLSIAAITTTADADPAEDSCRLLSVTSENRAADIEPLLNELASRWAPNSRNNAIETLTSLVRDIQFDGGNAYVVAKLGEDYEDHILAIRMKNGELAAARLTYEWTPDGMQLSVMNFKRRMSEMLPVGMPITGERIDCG